MRVSVASLFARLTASHFGNNTFLLLRASVLAQAALLLATPILTRLFDPEDFGVAGLFAVSAGLFCAMASWRFEWSVPSAQTDDDARCLTTISLLLATATAVVLQLLLTFVDEKVLHTLVGLPALPYAALLPLLALATSVAGVLSAAYVRARRMERVSHSKLVQAGTQLLGSLSAGAVGMAALGLVVVNALAAVAAALTLLRGFPFRLAHNLKEMSRLAATGRRYLPEASLSTAVSLANFSFGNCVPLLLLYGYSTREVGFYFVAMRLAGGPASLVSNGISLSFWAEAAELGRTDPEKLRRLYLKVIWTLTILFTPVAVLCLTAPFFLPSLLGLDEWSEIGIVVVACLPQIAGMFIFSSSNHLIVYGRQDYQLFSDLFSIASSVVVLWLAKAYGLPFYGAVLGTSIVILIAYLLRFVLHLQANRQVRRAFGQL